MASRFSFVTFASAILIAFSFSVAFAATGTVTNASPFAWSDNSGYVNWGAANGNVTITNTNLTGYIWASNHGWINLAAIGGGVTNTSSGVLGGFAWGQNTGWIDFTGVTIDPVTGIFHGHTVAQPVFGTMTFDCTTYCLVQTSWRPTSNTPGGNGSPVIYGGGGAGGYS
jgi:hypothetical protein